MTRILATLCAVPILPIALASPLTLRHGGATVRIDPGTLSAQQRSTAGWIPILAGGPGRAVRITSTSNDRASWVLVNEGVATEAALTKGGLSLTFRSARPQEFRLPLSGHGMAKALIVPESEGWYIPVGDPFWIRMLAAANTCRDTSGGLSMPFAGIETAAHLTITYVFGDDVRSKLCFNQNAGELGYSLVHRFGTMDLFEPFHVLIAIGGDSPVEPARQFRQYLIDRNEFVTFARKVEATPGAARLLGAMQIYISGRPDSLRTIEGLHRLGLERGAITYEEDQRYPASTIDPEAIRRAASYGYLIGPYDTFNNVQDPSTADGFESAFDRDLFENGGVMESAGDLASGFHNRGHHLSSKALRQAPRHYFEQRVQSRLDRGIDLYFLDVDATGELYDDYDPRHRMSREEDRRNRIDRMKFIVANGFVLGSESAAGWSVPYLHFTQGPMTPKSSLLWPFLNNKENFGGYGPARHPDIHYKEVDAPEDLVRITFDPRYRLPLYETVFHNSVVATDWAGLGLPKIRNATNWRALLSSLYNVPSLWWIDEIALGDYGERIKAMNAFFAPVHREFGSAAMTGFRWLTKDRLVQETRFGALTITANFGDSAYGELPASCVEAWWNGRSARYCPTATARK